MSSKAERIGKKLNEIIEALLSLGAVGVCSPTMLEIETDKDGFIDIPLKVRVSV